MGTYVVLGVLFVTVRKDPLTLFIVAAELVFDRIVVANVLPLNMYV